MRLRIIPPAVLFVLGLLAGFPLSGQEVIDFVQDVDVEEPEGWAMAYFTSTSLFTAVGAVEDASAGDVALGLELIQVPHLDREQRTVGFGGFKEEDLNRSEVWPRLRLQVGLPWGIGLSVGWVPPVEVDGVEGDLLAVALERRLVERGGWSLGARIVAQEGEVDGDFTCAEGGDELFPPGSAENPFGCEGPSADTVRMDAVGAQLVLAYSFGSRRGATVHAGVGYHRLDMEFQVRATTFGVLDRTLLRAESEEPSFWAGVGWDLGRRGHLGTELLYAPLEVRRQGQEREDDSLLHLRLLWKIGVGSR